MGTEQEITVQAAGLFDTGNNPWALPPGGLLVASDVEIGRDNVISGRRGMAKAASDQFARLFNFQTYVVGLAPSYVAYRSTSPFTSWTAYSTASLPQNGVWAPFQRGCAAESAKSLFVPGLYGAFRVESPTAAPVMAGMPPGRDVQAVVGAAGSAVKGQTRVAYRVVYGRKDANGRLILGAPSGRVIFTNTNASTTTNDVTLTLTIPNGPAGISSSDFVQVYRTSGTVDIAASTDAGDECYLVAEVAVPASATTTNLTRAASTVTATTSAAHGFSAGQYVYISPGSVSFPSGTKLLVTAAGSSFTYTEAGSATSDATSNTVYPVTMTVTDSQPDGTGGAALYTNPTQETILNQNVPPPSAADCAEFGQCLWFADVAFPLTAAITMLSVPASGLAITIGGIPLTAGASEDVASATFQRYTAGTASENIRDTAASLVRVLNRYLPNYSGLIATAQTDPVHPGKFSVSTVAPNASHGVVAAQTACFAYQIGTYVAIGANRVPNGLVYSKPSQPDHISQALASAPITVGSASEPIKRIVPTRSALFVLKNDGVWKVTGNAGEFTVTPLDPTTSILAPESALALDNNVYCLTDQGVARISEIGVEIISRPVEQIVRYNFDSTAMAAASEADHKYRLWNPAGFCVVFDPWTKTWTTRTEPFLNSSVTAVLNERTTGRLLVSGTSTVGARTGTYVENVSTMGDSLGETLAISASDQATTQNSYNITHGSASLVVGDTLELGSTVAEVIQATDPTHSIVLATALPTAGTYAVYRKTGQRMVSWQIRPSQPGMLHEWQELVFQFLANLGQRASVNIATDFVTSGTTNINLDLVQTRMTNGDGFNQIRVWPAREDSLSAVLVATLSWASSRADIRLAGLTTRFVPSSWQVSR